MHVSKKLTQEVNVKYGITLDYTVLEVSEVPHMTKMFQVLTKMNVQQEAQPTQIPAPNVFSSTITGKHRFKSPTS